MLRNGKFKSNEPPWTPERPSEQVNLLTSLTFTHSGTVVDDKGGNIFVIISHLGIVVGLVVTECVVAGCKKPDTRIL